MGGVADAHGSRVCPAFHGLMDLDSLVHHCPAARCRGPFGGPFRSHHVSRLAGAQGVGSHAGPPGSHARGRLARLGAIDCRRAQAAAQGRHHPGHGRQANFQNCPAADFRGNLHVLRRPAVQSKHYRFQPEYRYPLHLRHLDGGGHRHHHGGLGVQQQVVPARRHAVGGSVGELRNSGRLVLAPPAW